MGRPWTGECRPQRGVAGTLRRPALSVVLPSCPLLGSPCAAGAGLPQLAACRALDLVSGRYDLAVRAPDDGAEAVAEVLLEGLLGFRHRVVLTLDGGVEHARRLVTGEGVLEGEPATVHRGERGPTGVDVVTVVVTHRDDLLGELGTLVLEAVHRVGPLGLLAVGELLRRSGIAIPGGSSLLLQGPTLLTSALGHPWGEGLPARVSPRRGTAPGPVHLPGPSEISAP